MDKEYLLQTAKTIWQQLFWSVTLQTVWSWGVSKKYYTLYNNMPTLMLKVSGLVHKGWVYISLNEGKDLYEVRLMKTKQKCVRTLEDVFCDQLGRTIDELIEKPASMPENKYRSKALAESQAKLFNAQQSGKPHKKTAE